MRMLLVGLGILMTTSLSSAAVKCRVTAVVMEGRSVMVDCPGNYGVYLLTDGFVPLLGAQAWMKRNLVGRIVTPVSMANGRFVIRWRSWWKEKDLASELIKIGLGMAEDRREATWGDLTTVQESHPLIVPEGRPHPSPRPYGAKRKR